MKRILLFTLLLALILAACAPAPAASQTPPPTDEGVISAPMPVILPDGSPAAVTEMVVAEIATYTDDAYNFSFDYPVEWMLDVIVLGDRAPHSIQLTSWTHDPGMIEEVTEGGTVVNVIVQLWGPKGDLAAFVQQRKDAWSASGISILLEEEVTLADGRLAREFVVQSADGEGYFFFTVLGDQYLVISGSGDIESIRAVALSLR